MQVKTALVTGAAVRLGRAMALALAEDGFDVAVHYASSEDAAHKLVEEITAMGRKAVPLQADLYDEGASRDLLPRAAKALQRPVAVLVNNASTFEYDNIANATRDSWDHNIGSDLRAPLILTQALAAQVPDPIDDSKGEPVAQGLVVNMIDQRVRKLTPEFMTYTLAKSALWTLTRTSAQALGPRVRVNAIGPGPTLIAARQSKAHFTRQRAATILQRGSNPEDIIGALRYFLAARAVTGQLICVDGGQHLAWKTADVQGME